MATTLRWFTWPKEESINARPRLRPDYGAVLCTELGICERLRKAMSAEYVIALVVAAALAVYLFYALLRPERF